MLSVMMHKIQSIFQPQDMQKTLGWLHTLPEMAALDVLIETRQQLSKIQFETIYEAKNQIELVLKIDRNTYRQAKKETHKYLTILKINKKLEFSIYNAAYLYYRQLYVSYTQFLACYQSQAKVVLAEDKINLILCRLLNAAFSMAKWRYFDDQPAPAGMWTTVHNVIRLAENLAIMNKNLFMYNFHRKETSIATILKLGFMMDTLHKGNYSRLQIQLTEQVLKIWATNPLILNKYRQDKMQFFIQLEGDKGPERIRSVEKYAEYRFWKTTRVVDQIEAYLCAVATQKPLTAFGLDKVAPPSVVLKLFKKLRAEWCVEGFERQRRKESRHKNSKLLNVSHGLDNICERLKAINASAVVERKEESIPLDFRLAQQRKNNIAPIVNIKMHQRYFGNENWWMVDESAAGFAVDLGKEYSAWIEPGVLVGYTTVDDKNTLMIAEIRSVRKLVSGVFRAGLEVLGAHSALTKVARIDKNNETEAESGYFLIDSSDNRSVNFSQLNIFSGVFITQEDGLENNEKASLILPRNEYKSGSQYMVHINGKDKIVQAGALERKQRDWVSVAISI
ncbi:hypothetical protein [Methylotenera sp. 73s]|uniref:hypothetical protein n=2 Tax=Methylotenera TaxID=359407 RepID=UPI00037F0AC1|nr:hypothetical protein [Methylotenera sp. 73s]